MFKSKRILLISSSVILICCCIIAGATYALFTDSDSVPTHLKAGDLDATLIRNSYVYTVLDNETGELQEYKEEKDVNSDELQGQNFFGMTDGMLIVPGSYVEATFTVANGGTAAFIYRVDIDLDKETEEASKALAEQLYVTVTKQKDDGTWEEIDADYLVNGLDIPEAERVLKGGSSARICVRVEFENDANKTFVNDSVMNKGADFDLVVSATQDTPVNPAP